MKQGKVKWLNKEKGYGFIEVEGERDYFVNKYNIEDIDYLKEGDKVEFEIKEKDIEAFKVRKITTMQDLSEGVGVLESLIERLDNVREDIAVYNFIYNSTIKTMKDLLKDMEYYKQQLDNYEPTKDDELPF